MAFTKKDWKDFPDASTPVNATALEDIEQRLSDYTDTGVTGAKAYADTQIAAIPPPTSGLSSLGGVLEVAGSSIEMGSSLPDMTDRYSAVVAEYLNFTEHTTARAGSSLSRDSYIGSVGQYTESRQRFPVDNRSTGSQSGAYLPVAAAGIVGSPVNDLTGVNTTAFVPPTAGTITVASHALRSLIVDRVRSSAIDSSHSSITYSGTWVDDPNSGPVSGAPGAGANSSGDGARYSTSNGAYFEITIPGDYPGSAVAPLSIQFVGYANANGTATLTASNASSGTRTANTGDVSDATNSRAAGWVWRFAATSAGAGYIAPATNGAKQTLRITLSGITNGQQVGFDRVIIEADNAYAPKVAVMGCHKHNPFGLITMSVLTNQNIADMNAAIQSVVNEFGPHVAYIDADSILGGIGVSSAATTLTSDITTSTTNLPVASSANFTVGDFAMLDWREIVYVSAIPDSTHLTVARARFNYTAQASVSTTTVRKVNAAAIQNFLDGLHPSSLGHLRLARAVVTHLAGVTPTLQALSGRRGGVKADMRMEAYASHPNQISGVATNGFQFDVVLKDSMQIIDVGTGATQQAFTVTTDGMYTINLEYTWESTQTTGIRTVVLSMTSVEAIDRTLAQSTVPGAPSGFFLPSGMLTWTGGLRRGDVFRFVPVVSTGNLSTTLTGAHDATQTTFTVASTTGMTANLYFRVDNEHIKIGTVASGTSLTGCTRDPVTAASHANAASVRFGAGLIAGSRVSRQNCHLRVWRIGPYAGSVML